MADVLDSLKLRQKYNHFRILVIGRANAGKTTLLKRVCNTTEDPRIYNEGENLLEPTLVRGCHDINRPFAFEKNPQFIFHDSPGFEAGEESQLKEVQAFIEKRAKSTEPDDQLHAIWFCFRPDSSRPLLDLEKRFFHERRAGNVPVIAIFTKFDDLITQVWKRRLTMDENRQVALDTLENKFEAPLRASKCPPSAYLCLENMQKDDGNHEAQVGELTKKTADSLDDLALKMLFVSVQQNNLELCISYAIKYAPRNFESMNELVAQCLAWFRHSWYDEYDYGTTEGWRVQEPLAPLALLAARLFSWEAPWPSRSSAFFRRCMEVEKILNMKFDRPQLNVFAAILICLENSFWSQSFSVSFSDSFQHALESYTQSGVREKLEAWFILQEDQLSREAFASSLLETVLKHRLPRSDNLIQGT